MTVSLFKTYEEPLSVAPITSSQSLSLQQLALGTVYEVLYSKSQSREEILLKIKKSPVKPVIIESLDVIKLYEAGFIEFREFIVDCSREEIIALFDKRAERQSILFSLLSQSYPDTETFCLLFDRFVSESMLLEQVQQLKDKDGNTLAKAVATSKNAAVQALAKKYSAYLTYSILGKVKCLKPDLSLIAKLFGICVPIKPFDIPIPTLSPIGKSGMLDMDSIKAITSVSTAEKKKLERSCCTIL